jgi:hypothetical protein
MTCGFSEPLVTAGDRRCPYSTVAARTQRGPSANLHLRCPLYDGVAPWALRGGVGLASGGCAVHDGTVDVSSDAEVHLAWP